MQRQFTLVNERGAAKPAVTRVRVQVIDGPNRGLVSEPTGPFAAHRVKGNVNELVELPQATPAQAA